MQVPLEVLRAVKVLNRFMVHEGIYLVDVTVTGTLSLYSKDKTKMMVLTPLAQDSLFAQLGERLGEGEGVKE